MSEGRRRKLDSRPGRRLPRQAAAYLGVAALASAVILVDSGGADRAYGQAQDPAASKGTVGWDTYRDPAGLAQLRGSEQSRQFSSHDRAGGNDDGFNGTYSCLRQSEEGCVIADRAGAGEISSMWFTHETYGDVAAIGNIKIELDGKTVLDAPLKDVVDGKVGAPFSWPLVANADDNAGGAVIKVPMPYRESMRVTVQNNPNFYHVDYREFPDAAGVRTFDPADPATDVIDRLRHFGVADPKGADPRSEPQRADFDLAPGGSQEVAEADGPGRINQLRLRLPQVTAAPQVVDDGRAFGPGGGSQFSARVDGANQGVRITRRFDPQVADQVGGLAVDGQPAGEWRSGAAAPGQWGVQSVEVPPELTAGQSTIDVANQFRSSSVDVNEFRYDVESLVNGEWVRTDVLDLGPSHPGEEQAHGYRIDNQTFERTRLPGRYATPPEEVAASDEVLEKTRLRISFDGKTTVDAPVGEFFGAGMGEHDVRNMMSSVDPGQDGWYTSWWPMPFSENAEVELVNESGIPIRGASAEVSSAPADVDENTGYFHATHKRGPTTPGQDWNFLDAQGAGTFYGVTHNMRGKIPPGAAPQHPGQPMSNADQQANQRNYLEGDERFYPNGSSSPSWHGTGSEDYYESGWYFRDGTTFSAPLSGNPAHEINGDGCQFDCTGAYRLQVPDAVPFTNGLRAGIEHGPNNDEPGDYSSTAYWYGGKPATTRETDQIDLGDQADRDAHQYQAGGEQVGPLNSTFEGERNPAPFTDDSTTATGPVSFQTQIDQNNNGARLRRLGDDRQPYQQARVLVDGQDAGIWKQPNGNEHHRWLEDTFELPPALTQGKDSVHVELLPVEGAPPWAAVHYTVFSH